MLRKSKNILYFLVARYFRFFARIRLKRWNPRVVVVTGSNGKTTTLHLIEVQLGKSARYSYGANSSFGIPFDILGLKRVSYSPLEWIQFAFLAPLRARQQPFDERIYVVEADCDRPYEGVFLSSLLTPEVTIWLSSARTHSMNFERSVRRKKFSSVDAAIAHEFGNFLEHTSGLVIANSDESRILEELKRTKATVQKISEQELGLKYHIGISGTEFTLRGAEYHVPFLLPKEAAYSIEASVRLAEYFGKQATNDIWKLQLPPGRSSLFKGIQNTTLVDSTYNANAASVAAILGMAKKMPGDKWLVLGDLIEQGSQEKEEHEKVARMLQDSDFKKILLVGPRLRAYALPLLKESVAFDKPHEALAYLKESLKGGETIVFKGARFLEGVVEHLLLDASDAEKLCRREAVWQKRRAEWNV